jgi:hypothetical protein
MDDLLAIFPTNVYVCNSRSRSAIDIETPTQREYTIIRYLQGKKGLRSFLPFSIGTNMELVFNESSEEFRAVDLYNLMYDMVTHWTSILEFLSGDFHSSCPFEKKKLEGMRKAVDLLGGFNAAWDFSNRITMTDFTDMVCDAYAPTVFCDL